MRSKNRSVDKIARVLGASRRKLEEHRGYSEQLELCIRILSSILTLLFRKDVGSTCEEFQLVAQSLLRTVTQACVPMLQYTDEERKSGIVYQTISVLLEMMRQMDKEQYIKFMEHFSSRAEVLDFLSEMQALLKDLVGRPVYLPHWADMINLQNNIILNALRLFSVTLVDQFYEPFERQVWSNWFHLAISFVTQPALQLELLTPNQKKRLTCKYSDMRCDAAFEIRNMWFNLGQYKTLFVPCLVGPFLEMSLIPETELRKATIPLFFDMMQCEFNSSKLVAESYGDTKIDSSHCKAHFNEFENEMIHKLDVLVEGGQGDAEWRALFVSLVGQQCLTHATLREAGVRFVAIVGRLLDTLLTYRASHDHSSIGHRMQATTKLLDFYAEIERPQMYIRYVNKLCELQEAGECWTEAGLALRLHAKLLHWSDSPLPPLLCSRRHPLATTHRQLKEALFYDIVEYLERGKMWEMAVETCKEVARQCEEEVFDYCQLAELHDLMSRLYNNIVRQPRPSPEYFRVGYYGQGYPDFLRNRVFVYRGKEYERLTDFSDRMLNSMPKAELMTKLTAPGDDILLSPKQYLQINAVEPVMCTKSNRLSGKPISQQIMNYYMYNNVKHFQYSRPFHRHDEAITNSDEDSSQNEFASLWLERTELEISDTLPGIVQWFPVVKTKTYELCPLEVAIETMTQANKSLKQLVLEHKADQNLPLHPLSRKLTGMVDPAVMGGTRNYERAFLTEEYARIHPEHRSLIAQLKDLIATQIPLLEFGVEVHRIRAPPTLAPLHQRIAECFDKMRAHVHLNYGKKSCDLDKELPSVTMRRQILSLSNGSTLLNGHSPDNRLSEISTQTNDSLSTQRNTNSSIKHAITSSFNKQSNRGSLGSTGFGTLNFSKTGGSNILSMTPVTSPSRKRDKEKRRGNRKSETGSITSSPALVGASQWYTGSAAATPTPTLRHPHHSMSVPATTGDVTTPVFELRQELTASRPLRSEVERERRMSQRPNSIQSGTNSNRNSVGTTDSNISNEDDPPPLPLKASRSDSTYTKHSENEDSILQAINHSISETHTFIIRTSSVTELDAARSPVLRRQDYDTVLSPRGSFLYSSLQPNSRGHLNSNKEKAPTPPPKKRNQSSIVK